MIPSNQDKCYSVVGKHGKAFKLPRLKLKFLITFKVLIITFLNCYRILLGCLNSVLKARK